MANSCKYGPLNLPVGVIKIPARTCGPYGYNDQGDPNRTTLLGDSPGPLGWNDWSMQNLPKDSSIQIPYAGAQCKSSDGVPLSMGGGIPATRGAATASNVGARITTALLKVAEAGNTDEYYDSIVGSMNEYAAVYAVNTPLRIAHFLSQISHESKLRIIEENGNYSAKRMREIFGCKGGKKNYDATKDECMFGRLRDKLWTEESKYANNAKNLLGYVYANRTDLKNGDETSGDGYKYRGRGMIQLTGKVNYSGFTTAHNNKNPHDKRDFVGNPDLVITEMKYAVESAFFFWDSKGLNALADADNVDKVSEKVNGGSVKKGTVNGLEDRKARLVRIKTSLGI